MRRRFSRRRLADVDLAGDDGPDAELVHVRVRRMRQAARLRRGKHRDRTGLAVGDEVGPLERVHRDVDRGHLATFGRLTPDSLADVEHRRLVAFALADDDPSVELDLLHGPAHRLGRGRIGLIARAATHEPGGIDRRGLRHADHLER